MIRKTPFKDLASHKALAILAIHAGTQEEAEQLARLEKLLSRHGIDEIISIVEASVTQLAE